MKIFVYLILYIKVCKKITITAYVDLESARIPTKGPVFKYLSQF